MLTLAISATLDAAGAAAFVATCAYNVAAGEADTSVVAWVLHTAADRSVAVRLDQVKVPTRLDKPEMIKAGAKLFGINGVVYHVGPSLAPTSIA